MAQSGNSEHSFVADAQNWEDQVKKELGSQKQWQHNWGELYASEQGQSYQAQIDKLKADIEKVPGGRLSTISRSSWGIGNPHQEILQTKTVIPKNINDI